MYAWAPPQTSCFGLFKRWSRGQYCKEMPREILPRLQSNGFDTQKQLLNGMKDFCCKKHKTKRVTQILPNDPCPQLLNLLTFLKASASKGSAGMFGNQPFMSPIIMNKARSMMVPNDCIPSFLRSAILCTTYPALRSKLRTGLHVIGCLTIQRLGTWLLACQGHYIPSGLGFGLSLFSSLKFLSPDLAWRTTSPKDTLVFAHRAPQNSETRSQRRAIQLKCPQIFLCLSKPFFFLIRDSQIPGAKSVLGRGNSRLIAHWSERMKVRKRRGSMCLGRSHKSQWWEMQSEGIYRGTGEIMQGFAG